VPKSITSPSLKLVVGLSLMEELLQMADCCADLEQWRPVYAQASHSALDRNLATNKPTNQTHFCGDTDVFCTS